MNGTTFTPAFPQKNDPGHHVVIVDDGAIFPANRAAELAETYFGTLRHDGDIADMQGSSALRLDHGVGDIADRVNHADFAHVHLLQPRLNEAPSGVGVVVGQLLFHLADAQPVGDELFRIDAHLILARGTPEAGDVHHVGDRLEIFLDHPIFKRFQLHHVVFRIGAAQGVEIDLAHRAPVGPHLWVHARRQGHLRQPFQHALPIPGVLGSIFKDQLQIGQAEERERSQIHHVGNSVHGDFERYGYLLLDLLGRDPRPLSDNLDVVVRYIRICFHRQIVE
jgi:hypothetical protein